MITINLLPKEYQVKETTSPANLIIRGACLLTVGIIFLAFLVVHFYFLDNAIEEARNIDSSISQLDKAKKDHEDMTNLINQFKKRDETVDAIRSLRISFSKKLLEFSDVLAQDNFPIWLNSMAIIPAQAKPGTPPPNPSSINTAFDWKGACICASPTLQKATKFYEKIKLDPKFFKEFIALTIIPEFSRVDFGKEYQPSFGWNFSLSMTMASQMPEKPQDYRFVTGDILRPHMILVQLKNSEHPVIGHLHKNFIPAFKTLLEEYDDSWTAESGEPEPRPDGATIEIIAGQFNILLRENIYDKTVFSDRNKLRPDTQNLFAQNPTGEELTKANRALLEEVFAGKLAIKKAPAANK